MGCGSRRWEGDGIMGYGRGRGPGGRGRHQSIRVPTFPELPDPPGRPPPLTCPCADAVGASLYEPYKSFKRGAFSGHFSPLGLRYLLQFVEYLFIHISFHFDKTAKLRKDLSQNTHTTREIYFQENNAH